MRRKKVQFGKLRNPLREGRSQRCSSFTASQEVPLGKGRDHNVFGEVTAQENQFAEWALTPGEPRRGFTSENGLASASWSRALMVLNFLMLPSTNLLVLVPVPY